MGKHLRREFSGVPFENKHSGCMWGVLHILNFHQWHNVKKRLPHRRHGGGRHAAAAAGDKATGLDLNIPDTGGAQELIDAEVDNIPIEKEMIEVSPTKKISGKARMKALIAEEMSKEEDSKHQITAFCTQPRLVRIDSIHHLKPSEPFLLDGMSANGENIRIDLCEDNTSTSAISTQSPLLLKVPKESAAHNKLCEVCGTVNSMNYMGHNHLVEQHALFQDKLDKVKEALLKRKHMNSKDLSRDDPILQSKEFLDALEIFNLNTELFLNFLHDPDYSLANHFQGLKASNAKIGFTRSGSFPQIVKSGRKNVRLLEQKYKEKDNGSFPKQEGQLQNGHPPTNLATVKSSEDIFEQPMSLISDNNAVSALKPEQGNKEVTEVDTGLDSSLGSHKLKNRRENRVGVSRFKGIKERIKHAINESRKEHRRISMDAILHRIPYGRRFSKDAKKEDANQRKESATNGDGKDSPRSSNVSDSAVPDLSKGGLHRIRRTSSLSESLERYSQLFESTFSREATNHLSDMPKLTNENRGSLGGHAPKALARIFSLPEFESNFSLQGELSHDALLTGVPNRIHVDSNTNIATFRSDERKAELDGSLESGSQEILEEVTATSQNDGDQVGLALDTHDGENAELGGSRDYLNDQTIGESSFTDHHELEIEPATNASIKLAQPTPISVLDSCFQEDKTKPSKFSISEDSELKPLCIDPNELDSLVNMQEQCDMNTPSGTGSTMNLVNAQILSKHFGSKRMHVQVDKKDEADFNYVRNVLKLSGFINGNEYLRTWHSADQPLDPSLFEELERCLPLDRSINEASGSCDHEILFDLINDVLIEIYERSITYFPRTLSRYSHIRPMPVGYHVLEEVWTSISWYLNLQPEPNQSLDYIADRDLAKGDGWMNLQFDAECVALELEELILDDLLEEIIYSNL